MNNTTLVAMVAGAIGSVLVTLAFLYLGYQKQLKIGEGRKMGLNLTTNNKCPSCGQALPAFRRPKNFRQAMWGGTTCENCGTEFDKWLKPVSPK